MEPVSEEASHPAKRVTWEHDVRHFFTAQDVACMKGVSAGHIDLHDYHSVKRSAPAILGQVKQGNMPPAHSGEKPWSVDRVKQFEVWIAGGCP